MFLAHDNSSTGWRQRLSLLGVLGLICAATTLYFLPDFQNLNTFAPALLILAILTSRLVGHRLVTAGTSIVAALVVLSPMLVDITTYNPIHIGLWLLACGTAGVLAMWDPNRHSLDVQELENALHQAPTGLIITDLDGRICSLNATMSGIFGLDDTNLTGLHLQELVGPALWELIVDHRAELEAGEALDIEFELDSAERDRTLTGHGKLARDRRGKPRYYIIQVNDLTSEQAAKQALTVASQQLRRILTNSSDLVLVINQKLVVTFANESATTFLGSPNSEIIGQPVYRRIDETQRKAFMQAFAGFTHPGRNEVSISNLLLVGNQQMDMDVRIIRLSASRTSGYAMICKVTPAQLAALADERVNQDRFSQVFHGSPDAILILRARDNVIIDFNDGFTRLLGYAREDAIGDPELERYFWNNPVERNSMAEKLAANEQIIDHETTLRKADGSSVHVEISLRYIEIDGELCVLCIGRDITKRISAEAALVETETKFEKVFSESPDGIIIIRHGDGVITDLNFVFEKRSGFRRDEIIGAKFTDFPVTSDNPDTPDIVSVLDEAGQFTNQAVTFITKQGEEVPSLISATLLELNGEPHLMIIAKDISKQRATEERLRRSEERFRGIFENAPFGILLVDMEGRIFQANRTASELLAYEEPKMNGVHVSRLVPQDERPALKNALTQLANGLAVTHQSERKLMCQDGLHLWSNFHIVMQHSSAGAPLYYIVQIADISDIKQGQQRMEQMAFYDTLTNLANRRLFQDRLNQTIERCKRNDRSAALLYLDLDNFKRVNDTLGHQTGDTLLQEVARRLQDCVRAEDTVGRTGGDEFTIVLNQINTPADAGEVAQKILNHLREPFSMSGHPLVVTTSIGITVLPTDGDHPNTLMSNADLAMYKAKERGRNNYQFYSEDLNANAHKRLRTEYEIRNALENREFELFYQPKVSLQNRQIVGVESLIRWNHPERGLLAPNEFIEIAEETGSIIDIGSWVIEDACRACQSLSSQIGRPISVAINISPRQFRDPNLVTTVRRGLRESQLDPAHVELEITETMLMQDAEAASATVMRLSELGVKLAIDDFGTGYSSLNYLKRFPINTVKVDRSFVMDIPENPDDMAITRAVIAMAHQLNMQVVAEGVETREQLEFLAAESCEYAQGYLFSKPQPLSEIIRLIKADAGVVRSA